MTPPLESDFSKDFRIRRSSDFERIFQKGKRLYTEHFTFIYTPNSLGYPRLGLVVGKKFGNSVGRNRTKRVLREVFRKNKPLFNSLDILILAKGASP